MWLVYPHTCVVLPYPQEGAYLMNEKTLARVGVWFAVLLLVIQASFLWGEAYGNTHHAVWHGCQRVVLCHTHNQHHCLWVTGRAHCQ